MAVLKKVVGLVAGASAVAVIGVAVAQGVPPNPFVTNHALGAGQQSTHLTSMGETGTPWPGQRVVTTAEIVTAPQVAAVEVAPAPVIAEAPAPIIVEQTQMGAAPAPIVEQPAAAPMVAKADRG